MPDVNGVIETSLYVDDLDRSAAFYGSVFGFDTLLRDKRICAMSVAGRQVLLLFKKGASLKPAVTPGGTIPPSDDSGELRITFSIAASDLEDWERGLSENNVAIESRVSWKRGGRSLYFRDPDGHLLELAAPGLRAVY